MGIAVRVGVCPFTLLCGLFVLLACDPGGPEGDAEEQSIDSVESTLDVAGAPITPLPMALSAPLLDGLRDAQYQLGPALPIAKSVRGPARSSRDLSASFRALHDARALYLFVEVADEHVVTDSGAYPWEDDAIELFLDGNGSGGTNYDGVDDVQLIFRPGIPYVLLGTRSAPVRTSEIGMLTMRTEDGYRLEIVVPWSATHTTWRRDKVMSLDVQVDDDDDGGSRDNKISWWSADDEAWQYPGRFGRVRLDGSRRSYFAGIGDLSGGARASYVTDLSDSGEVTVGYGQGASGVEAFRFTMAHDLVALGHAPSQAMAVSPNGDLVVGSAKNSAGAREGARWRGTQIEFLLPGPRPHPEAPALYSLPQPTAVLNDGRVYGACIQYAAYGDHLGCRWDGPGLITLLGYGEIYAVDAQGNLGGTAYGSRYHEIRSVAILNGVRLGYPPRSNCLIPHDCGSEVHDFSTGAAVVIGTAHVPHENDDRTGSEDPVWETAFVYTQAEGMLRLGDLPGGALMSGANSVSADGRIIGGFGMNENGQQAVVWVGRNPTTLRALAASKGVSIPPGWRLLDVLGVSADGRTYAGNARNAKGDAEGFVLSLTKAP